jgi:GntR family transcriptional regulator/MocR family aminotransferase
MKRKRIVPDMLIPLKLIRDQPLQQQLYGQFRELIVSARLGSGTRMPSTRMLAEQFSISRITVLLTYERLIAEGYLTTLPAKGTFVSQAPMAQAPLPPACGLRVGGYSADPELPAGRPDARLFPASRWRVLIDTALNDLGANPAADPMDGNPALRQAIAHWLSASRGLAVDPDQIIVAAGRQHALHVAAHMLLRSGVRAVVESPCDARSERLIASTGATVIRVPVDEAGIQTDLLPDGPVAMVLVTPEHQRPLGAVMSRRRRHDLLAWAEHSGAAVIAEDVDGELRYEAMDAAPLMSLDRHGQVIHLGGFALSLGPCVQLAYLALPRPMVAAARMTSRLIDDDSGKLEAAALTDLLESGTYLRHLHRLRKIYLGRRDALTRSLRRHFGAETRITGTSAGLHLVWCLAPDLGQAGAVVELARLHGLDAARGGDHTVILGFGIPAETQIETSVSRLVAALRPSSTCQFSSAGGVRIPTIANRSLAMNRIVLAAMIIGSVGLAGTAQAAGDAAAGKTKAASCAMCHGPNGEGNQMGPKLAGENPDKFIQAMNDYKSGKLANPMMKNAANQLSAGDTANLAAYYASLK